MTSTLLTIPQMLAWSGYFGLNNYSIAAKCPGELTPEGWSKGIYKPSELSNLLEQARWVGQSAMQILPQERDTSGGKYSCRLGPSYDTAHFRFTPDFRWFELNRKDGLSATISESGLSLRYTLPPDETGRHHSPPSRLEIENGRYFIQSRLEELEAVFSKRISTRYLEGDQLANGILNYFLARFRFEHLRNFGDDEGESPKGSSNAFWLGTGRGENRRVSISFDMDSVNGVFWMAYSPFIDAQHGFPHAFSLLWQRVERLIHQGRRIHNYLGLKLTEE